MVHRDDDERLIQALLAQDRNAWCRFVERFQGLVYARVARTAAECNYQLDRNDLEDICAEVFACLVANDFSSLRRFEGRSSLATWLTVVARRVCLRCLQRKRTRAEAQQTLDEALSWSTETGDDALTALVAAEDAHRLYAMLDQLSSADQSVIRLFYLDNLSYAEIGKRLSISINTVGPKLQRAQKRLRALMELDGSVCESRQHEPGSK